MMPVSTFLAGLLSLLFITAPCQAKHVTEILFESQPPGATVSLLRGRKEELLGTTPFRASVSFRSATSIQRVLYRKPAHESVEAKLSGEDESIEISLPRIPWLSEEDAKSELGEALIPVLERELVQVLEKPPVTTELREACRLEEVEGRDRLVVPLVLREVDLDGRLPDRKRAAAMTEALWSEVAGPIVIAVASELGSRSLDVIVDVAFDENRHSFSVDSQVEVTIELECVAGSRQSWSYSSCARMVSGNCQAGNTLVTERDPCMHRVPITKSELIIDPMIRASRDLGHVQFEVPAELSRSAETASELRDQVTIRVIDEGGLRQGR